MSAEWFAGRLRELRGAAGLTQEQLAERAGVKRDAVARWEAGTREPSWSNVVALVKALGVDANAFLQEPASAPPVGPGRPRKVADADADQHQKRPRGRARKAPGVARGGGRPGGYYKAVGGEGRGHGPAAQAEGQGEVSGRALGTDPPTLGAVSGATPRRCPPRRRDLGEMESRRTPPLVAVEVIFSRH